MQLLLQFSTAAVQKPSIPSGTRDFGPEQMAKRQYILSSITEIFKLYGFQPLETPSIENLSVLTGKYGDEGDQLLYKILNSGDFLKKSRPGDYEAGSQTLLPKIADKGLRYDLTVPFARFVAMNRHALAFPFKRYQMQPVWRADRPQRGRYREFYQCDADVVGTDSLLCEAEIMAMVQQVMQKLKISHYELKLNNRKILQGVAELLDAESQFTTLCVAIDKLDKIGRIEVEEELGKQGFRNEQLEKLAPIFDLPSEADSALPALENWLGSTESGKLGIAEVKEVLATAAGMGIATSKNLKVDVRLARGLSYYTGCIFEVQVPDTGIGSVSGGGRYDNLTGVFGLPNVSGVGISFGIDRLYDVLEILELFPAETAESSQLLFAYFDEAGRKRALQSVQKLRAAGVKAEVYPEVVKLKKQLDYANKKGIKKVALIGDNELENKTFMLKNMASGEQEELSLDELILQFL